jgi:hypothetical protein
MTRPTVTLLLAASAAALTGCGDGQYSAEVGYYEGTTQRWHIGQPKSRSDCTAEAIGMYNRLNRESPRARVLLGMPAHPGWAVHFAASLSRRCNGANLN